MPRAKLLGAVAIFRWTLLIMLVALVACTDGTPADSATSLAENPTVGPPTRTPTPKVSPPTAAPELPLKIGLSIEGEWEGVNFIAGAELEIIVQFASNDDFLTANIRIPQQGANLPLSNVTYRSGRVHFELESPLGTAVWDGELLDTRIHGEFHQAGLSGTFQLTRAEMAGSADDTVDLPYQEEEVIFRNGEITLAGTLTMPPGDGPHLAAVMISGSGPQNRDEEIFGFKIFRVIADYLTRQGIAVLRYDDRGVGGSTGDIQQANLEDFAGDVQAAVDLLKLHPETSASQVGLIGHSEGAIVAPLLAAKSEDVAFVVLIAGSGVPGDVILRTQLKLIFEAGGATEEEIAEALDLQTKTLEAVRTGEGWEELEAEARRRILESVAELPESQRAAISDVNAYVESVAAQEMEALRSPWLKSFVEHDPSDSIKQLTVPILALFGELDVQVPARLNEMAMAEAVAVSGNSNFSSRAFPEANHLFQRAVTGSPDEYPTLKREFVPGFLEAIGRWILERAELP